MHIRFSYCEITLENSTIFQIHWLYPRRKKKVSLMELCCILPLFQFLNFFVNLLIVARLRHDKVRQQPHKEFCKFQKLSTPPPTK